MRKYLPENSENKLILVEKNGTYYTILDTIGSGGSSLIYRVSSSKSESYYVIKEIFPSKDSSGFSFVRDEDFNVIPASDETDKVNAADYLNNQFKIRNEESKNAQIISRTTGRAAGSFENIDVKEIIYMGKHHPVKQPRFIILNDLSGKGASLVDFINEAKKDPDKSYPLRCGGNLPINISLRIMEEVLRALVDQHKDGYYFGDIQPSNIFFLGGDVTEPYVGYGVLLDFGTCKKLDLNGCATDFSTGLYSTEGYCAPEMHPDNEELCLSPQTDLFAAGLLFYYLIVGFKEAYCYNKWRQNRLYNLSVSQDELSAVGGNKKLLGKINAVLSSATSFERTERFPDFSYSDDKSTSPERFTERMLKCIIELVKLTNPQPHYYHILNGGFSSAIHFIPGSRNNELQRIDDEIKGKKPVWIWGLGGIGKTELAISYLERVRASGDEAFFIKYRGSMFETVRSLEFGKDEYDDAAAENNAEQDYRNKLGILNKEYKDSYFVIDNFDVQGNSITELQEEEAYKDVIERSALSHIIITTRSIPEGQEDKELQPLSKADLKTLFLKCVHINSKAIKEIKESDRDIVQDLITAFDSHTLAVELAAKTIERNPDLSVTEFTELLKTREIENSEFKEVISDKDRHRKSETIYGHIKNLFNIAGLSDSEKIVMQHAVLLPDEGIASSIFYDLEKKQNLSDYIYCLNEASLIRGNGGIVSIHPLIKEVCKKELSAAIDNYIDFFHATIEICVENRSSEEYINQLYFLTRNIEAFIAEEPGRLNAYKIQRIKDYKNILFTLADWSRKRIEYNSSMNYIKKVLNIEENYLTNEEKFNAYTIEAENHWDNGEYMESRNSYQSALYAKGVYSISGWYVTYNREGKKYLPKYDGLKPLNSISFNDIRTIAIIYIKQAECHLKVGMYEKAIDLISTATLLVDLIEIPSNDGIRILIFLAKGDILYIRKLYDQALIEYRKAYAIVENAIIDINVQNMYTLMEKIYSCSNAIGEYPLEQVLFLYEKINRLVPEKHPITAKCQDMVGELFGKIAWQYEINNKSIFANIILEYFDPQEHIPGFDELNNFTIFKGNSNLSDFEKNDVLGFEESYLSTSLNTMNSIWPETHYNKVKCLCDIASMYADRREFTKALQYIEKALQISDDFRHQDNWERSLGFNHLQFLTALNLYGIILFHLGKIDAALSIMTQVVINDIFLRRYEKLLNGIDDDEDKDLYDRTENFKEYSSIQNGRYHRKDSRDMISYIIRFNLGIMYEETGKYDMALKCFENLLRTHCGSDWEIEEIEVFGKVISLSKILKKRSMSIKDRFSFIKSVSFKPSNIGFSLEWLYKPNRLFYNPEV